LYSFFVALPSGLGSLTVTTSFLISAISARREFFLLSLVAISI